MKMQIYENITYHPMSIQYCKCYTSMYFLINDITISYLCILPFNQNSYKTFVFIANEK